MSASAEYLIIINGISILADAFRELRVAQSELDKIDEIAKDIENQRAENWKTTIRYADDVELIVSKKDKEICIEPADPKHPKALETVNKIKQVYSKIKVLNDLKKKGYDKVKEEKLPDGSIRFVVQKWQ